MLFAPEEPGTETLKVPVIKVFDGDGFLTRIPIPERSLEVEAAVRFGFIDAPEMGQPGGREARDFLSGLIAGQWLDLVILMKMDTGGSIDRHGRIVAVPYLMQKCSDRDVGQRSLVGHLAALFGSGHLCRNIELEMVLNGWAWVLDRYGPEPHYFDALEDARRHHRGIWARSDNIHPWEFKKQNYRKKVEQLRTQSPQPDPCLSGEPHRQCPTEDCEGQLVQRSGKFGTFYGCSRFPQCRYSRSSI